MSLGPLPSGPEALAIALVVESSLVVAAEWPRIIIEYIAQMLKRLSDANPGYRLRIGFVTYATASTTPSPVLCKRFFTEFSSVMREMREDPAKLGIGQTNSGGSRGMAALEGLVGAIELFDILHTCPQPARPYVNHIFHIAASAPDTSIHPRWNDSPLLDSVTWEDLPSELKQRNINISFINLHPNLPRFTDLHLAVAQGTSKDLPWFNVRLGHTILISGLPVPLQKSAKRAGDPHPTERTPDPKRLRLASQSAAETKTGAPNTPSNTSKPSPVPPHVQAPPHISFPPISQPLSQPPTQPPPSSQAHGLPPNAPPAVVQYQALVNNLRAVEDQLRNIQLSIQSARAAGNTAAAESLLQEFNKKNVSHQKVKHSFMAFTARMHAQVTAANQNQNQTKQGQAQMQGQGQQVQQSGGPASSNTLTALQSQQLASSADVPNFTADGRPDMQMLAQMMHRRTLSGSSTGAPTGVVPPAVGKVMSAPVATQMQKLVEQTQRTRPDGQGTGTGQGVGVGVGDIQQGQTQSGSLTSDGAGKSSQFIWQGSLTWSGTNPSGEKKEVTVYVIASTPNPSESVVETWPQAMSLVPIRSVPMPDLRLWLARLKPTMCTFTPQMHGVLDVQANAASVKMLVNLLATKHYYATSSWTRPSGEQGSNALFFPTGHGLTGAIFPVTGLPELPKPSSIPGLPAEVVARMQQMPPDQMDLVLMQWRKHREGATTSHGAPATSGITGDMTNSGNSFEGGVGMNPNQQQADLGSGDGLSTFGSHAHHLSNNYGGGLNIMNTMGIGLGQSHNMGLSATLPRPVSVGGSVQGVGAGIGPGNVSYEMLKSFMQRGGGNANMSGQGQG